MDAHESNKWAGQGFDVRQTASLSLGLVETHLSQAASRWVSFGTTRVFTGVQRDLDEVEVWHTKLRALWQPLQNLAVSGEGVFIWHRLTASD